MSDTCTDSVSKPVVQYFMVLHVPWYCTRDTLERYVPGMYVPSLVGIQVLEPGVTAKSPGGDRNRSSNFS